MVDKRLPKRFWDKVKIEPNSGCWLWEAARSKSGYGCFVFGGSMKRAHRVSYEVLREKIPDGLHIDHLCRVRCCVNPYHLEPVTPRENTHRSPIHQANRTHCPQGHPYDDANTQLRKNGWRDCKECVQVYRRRKAGEETNDQS